MSLVPRTSVTSRTHRGHTKILLKDNKDQQNRGRKSVISNTLNVNGTEVIRLFVIIFILFY